MKQLRVVLFVVDRETEQRESPEMTVMLDIEGNPGLAAIMEAAQRGVAEAVDLLDQYLITHRH